MALSSNQIMDEIRGMGDMPNFKDQITQAYQGPVLKPLVDEGAGLEANILPSLFQPFTQMGTGAADMSPEAKLSAIGGSLGRLFSRLGSNQSMQNFFGGQISDLAGTMSNSWQDKRSNLWNQYQALAQQEAQRRAAAAARQQQIDWSKYLSQGGGSPQVSGTSTVMPGLKVGQFSPTGSQLGDVAYGAARGVTSIPVNIATGIASMLPRSINNQLNAFQNSSPFLQDLTKRTNDLINRVYEKPLMPGYENSAYTR